MTSSLRRFTSLYCRKMTSFSSKHPYVYARAVVTSLLKWLWLHERLYAPYACVLAQNSQIIPTVMWEYFIGICCCLLMPWNRIDRNMSRINLPIRPREQMHIRHCMWHADIRGGEWWSSDHRHLSEYYQQCNFLEYYWLFDQPPALGDALRAFEADNTLSSETGSEYRRTRPWRSWGINRRG